MHWLAVTAPTHSPLAIPQWLGDLGTWVAIIAGVMAIIAFTYGFTRFVVAKIRHALVDVFKTDGKEAIREVVLEETAPLKARLDNLEPLVIDIQAEMKPNSGSSLRDRVDAAAATAAAALAIGRQVAGLKSEEV